MHFQKIQSAQTVPLIKEQHNGDDASVPILPHLYVRSFIKDCKTIKNTEKTALSDRMKSTGEKLSPSGYERYDDTAEPSMSLVRVLSKANGNYSAWSDEAQWK